MNSAIEPSQLSDSCPVPLWKFYFPNQGDNIKIVTCYLCF